MPLLSWSTHTHKQNLSSELPPPLCNLSLLISLYGTWAFPLLIETGLKIENLLSSLLYQKPLLKPSPVLFSWWWCVAELIFKTLLPPVMLSFLLGLKISWTLMVAFEVQAMGICCSSFLVNHFAKAFGYDADSDEY